MSLIKFWKKDIINKMIVITAILLAMGVIILIGMIVSMPSGKSLSGVFSEILPEQVTATFIPPTPTATEDTLNAGFSVVPTFTAFPTMTESIPTETRVEAVSETPTVSPEDVSTIAPDLSAACIPVKTPQTGRVVEVVDGSTIRVLMNGLVYVVRYIGVDNPAGKFQSENARIVNSNLVYGKDIKLIADQIDKDANGRFLRYVLVGDTFVNLELLQKGTVLVSKSAGAASCDSTFEGAELSASSAGLGIWAIASPTPKP